MMIAFVWVILGHFPLIFSAWSLTWIFHFNQSAMGRISFACQELLIFWQQMPMLGFKYVQSHHAWLFPVFILQSQRENITQKSCCQKPNCWSLFFHYSLRIKRCKMKNHIIYIYMLLLLKEANRRMFHWKCPFSKNVAAFKLPQLRCVVVSPLQSPKTQTKWWHDRSTGEHTWIRNVDCSTSVPRKRKSFDFTLWRLS